jgi:predicted P-loop ATPase
VKLTSDDYAALERSYITRKVADTAGLYRVPSIEGRDLVGRKGAGDYAGVVFPYFWPGTKDSVLDRLRLDSPPADAATGKPRHKYLTAAGSRNRLYLPPCDPALVGDTAMPVVFTEGEKKCLGLWRAALESNGTGKAAFLPMAIPGVWSWRGTTGIQTNANGERVPEKGVMPDLGRIAWMDRYAGVSRKVTILFDTNAATNSSVQAARRELARELTRRGAQVWIAELPPLTGVNGVDDLLGLFGLERALEVLKSATLWDWYKELIRSDKNKILPILANAITALRWAPEWCGVLAFNEHALNISTTRETPWGPVATWADHHTYLLVDWLQRHGLKITITDTNAAVETVARDRSYHPVREYLDSLVWDGIGRLDDWLTLYLGAPTALDESAPDEEEKLAPAASRHELTRAISARWPISAVARVYEPGCQADHVLILEGPQGQGKSTALRTLGEPFYSDDIAELGTKDASLGTAGVWIVELPELDAMTRAEVSKVKSFVSRRTDRFRPPYGRRLVEAHRQCVFAGSVNHSEYLRDETGGRRFWPVECGRIDLDSLRRDKDQLWAEAVARYRKREPWWLDTPALIQSATNEQEARYLADPWEDVIAEWVDKRQADLTVEAEITTADVLRGALSKEVDQWSRADETRVGIILRRLGWGPVKRPAGKSRRRTYCRRSDQPN